LILTMATLILKMQAAIRQERHWLSFSMRKYLRMTLVSIAAIYVIVFIICRQINLSSLNVRLLRGTETIEIDEENGFALYHSYVFDDITDKEIEIYQKPVKEAHHYFLKDDPNKGSDNLISNCPLVIKMDGTEDGGKWTCDPGWIARSVMRRNDKRW